MLILDLIGFGAWNLIPTFIDMGLVLVLAGFLIFNLFVPGMAVEAQFRWGIGLAGLSIFTAAEMQGSSPLMRGEQANWIPEAILGAVLLVVYFLVPLLLGWNIL